ncbi:phosphatidylglycerol lysyltransferase domain-containing protein [Vallitaleaceae bacterium 9-2]
MQTDSALDIDTCRDFEELSLENIEKYNQYLTIRRIESCEFGLTTLFLWKNRNHQHVYVDTNFMLVFGHFNEHCFSQMPLCKEEYFKEAFEKTIAYFKQFDESFVMYSVDKKFADFVSEEYADTYEVVYDRNYSDYIYDANRMRELPGKKLRKKRNHINAFLRDYENKYSYRLLSHEDRDEINEFLEKWTDNHDHMTKQVDHEIEGIDYIIDHLDILGAKALGIYIEGQLEAMSIASTINDGEEVIVHVEKANTEIRGLYPFLSQVFLQEFYPEAKLVNREEDLGIEGLRKSKLSYEPIRLEDKYTIRQKK